MNIKNREIYSEVNAMLDMLGEEYVNKLPNSLFNTIREESLKEYTPIYNPSIALQEQSIKRETLSMIALLHINYWCNTEEEKESLKSLFNSNESKYQNELRENYNPDNLFKEKSMIINEGTIVEKDFSMIEYNKPNFLIRIINKFKELFK